MDINFKTAVAIRWVSVGRLHVRFGGDGAGGGVIGI